jgi:beta-glucosidase
MWHTGKPAAEQCEGKPASGASHKVPRRLVGFASVEVAPGESAEVAVVVSRRALSTFEPGRGWREPSGPTILSVGRSSRDLRLQAWLE